MRIGSFIVLCFSMAAFAVPSAAQEWCYDADSVYAVVVESSIIIHHDAALYNCCADEFAYTITQDEATIGIDENEILTEPCYCICCYNQSTVIENVDPGDYLVVFRWYDYESDAWQERELFVTIPDHGQTGQTALGEASWSGCITETSVPTRRDWTWGSIKTLFR